MRANDKNLIKLMFMHACEFIIELSLPVDRHSSNY